MGYFITIFSLLIPITFILIGYVFWKHAPREINGIAGWRTKQATRNQQTWDYANTLGGKCTLLLGCIEFICTSVILIFTLNLNEDTLAGIMLLLVLIQSACFAIIYVYVERKLKANFH